MFTINAPLWVKLILVVAAGIFAATYDAADTKNKSDKDDKEKRGGS